jgi:hypothetical protein
LPSDSGFPNAEDGELTVVYDGAHPILQLYLEANEKDTTVKAVVDSGSHRTLLPVHVADALGIPKRHRRRTSGRGPGGHKLRTWTSEMDVTAQVIARPGGLVQPWGAEFRFAPSFAKIDMALLGRIDFFHFFVVTFEERERLLRLQNTAENFDPQ